VSDEGFGPVHQPFGRQNHGDPLLLEGASGCANDVVELVGAVDQVDGEALATGLAHTIPGGTALPAGDDGDAELVGAEELQIELKIRHGEVAIERDDVARPAVSGGVVRELEGTLKVSD
jgi:hypothetical protein